MAGLVPALKERPAILSPLPEDVFVRPREAVDEDGYLTSTPTMPELTPHHIAVKLAIESLDYHLDKSGQECLCVGNVLLYDLPGQRRRFLSPDIILFLTPPPGGQARVYKAWEGDLPDLVAEVLSDSTLAKDLGEKKKRYAQLGIAEYWIFAPPEFHIEDQPALQGFRLGRHGYEPIAPVAAQVKGYAAELYPSAVLGAAWGEDAQALLRLFSPLENDWCPLSREVRQLWWQAQRQLIEERARADREQARADRAETQAAHERTRAQQAETQAAHERTRAQQAETQAAHERTRAQQAETQAAHERTRAQQAETQAARERTRAQETMEENARLRRLLHEQGIALPDERPENGA